MARTAPQSVKTSGAEIRLTLERLFALYPVQRWWPGDTPFEIAAGAVLVQNASWRNAELALEQLRTHNLLVPERVAQAPFDDLASVIRSSGTFRVKAARLQALSIWWQRESSQSLTMPTAALRTSLLKVQGIGGETADCILLYAFQRPVFVADAYARRWLGRLGLVATDAAYCHVQFFAHTYMPQTAAWLGAAHAAIVEHGKAYCGRTPRCSTCPLAARCDYAGAQR